MDKIKKTVVFTLQNPLESCLEAGYYILTVSVGIWALAFALKLGKMIILGY